MPSRPSHYQLVARTRSTGGTLSISDHPSVTGKHLAIRENDVMVVITQAFGPRGDSLVGVSEVVFDGHPAVTLAIRALGQQGLVHLSPIHGDARKIKPFDIPTGARCELLCPVSGQPFDIVGEVEDGSGARYCAIYLTPHVSRGSMVMVSDVWVTTTRASSTTSS